MIGRVHKSGVHGYRCAIPRPTAKALLFSQRAEGLTLAETGCALDYADSVDRSQSSKIVSPMAQPAGKQDAQREVDRLRNF